MLSRFAKMCIHTEPTDIGAQDTCLTYPCADVATHIMALLERAGVVSDGDLKALVSGPDVDRRTNYRLFELVAAMKFRAVPWFLISSKDKKRLGLPTVDKGVDCVSEDLTHAYQVKWYSPKQTVDFHKLSTFYTTGRGVLKAKSLTAVISEGVKVSKDLPEEINVVTIGDAELIESLRSVWLARRGWPVSADAWRQWGRTATPLDRGRLYLHLSALGQSLIDWSAVPTDRNNPPNAALTRALLHFVAYGPAAQTYNAFASKHGEVRLGTDDGLKREYAAQHALPLDVYGWKALVAVNLAGIKRDEFTLSFFEAQLKDGTELSCLLSAGCIKSLDSMGTEGYLDIAIRSTLHFIRPFA